MRSRGCRGNHATAHPSIQFHTAMVGASCLHLSVERGVTPASVPCSTAMTNTQNVILHYLLASHCLMSIHKSMQTKPSDYLMRGVARSCDHSNPSEHIFIDSIERGFIDMEIMRAIFKSIKVLLSDSAELQYYYRRKNVMLQQASTLSCLR